MLSISAPDQCILVGSCLHDGAEETFSTMWIWLVGSACLLASTLLLLLYGWR